MTLPVLHLPVVQNWDCHVCGSCCKDYIVFLTNEERQRIEAQQWENDLQIGGLPVFVKRGPWWKRRYHLNHRDDGSCVFLSEEGRCRIHEKFGYETKPLPCRLFPFVLVPAGDHWRVGMRYACPSAAGNKGRAVELHEDSLRRFATELARREGLDDKPGDMGLPPPRLHGRQRLDWSDLFRLVDSLLKILSHRQDRIERRLRKCLMLGDLCRQARLDNLKDKRLVEFLNILSSTLEGDVPAEPTALPPPNWAGRVLFRQAVALHTRKDHGPNRGEGRKGRGALLRSAWRFFLGTGPVPQLDRRVPFTTFEKVEATTLALPAEAEEILERYYTVKVESLQFCGATNFGLPFWEGFEMLALTYPILMWVTRACASELSPTEALLRALTIVDDHFGFNKVLRSRRQRFSFRIIARTGELQKLIAWYGR
jgi:lysine-N-methylase